MERADDELIGKHCVPCEVGGDPMEHSAADAMLARISSEWKLGPDYAFIRREYVCKDFADALAFINKVGAVAEREGHHPDMLLHGWNLVTLTLSTHAVGGLTENDFILAAKIDSLQ